MAIPFYTTAAVGIVLEWLLVWRLWRCGGIKRYPYFATFLVYDLSRSIILVALFYFSPEWHARVYWDTEAFALVLLFAIMWEVVRNLFPAASSLRQLAWKTVLSVEAVLLPCLLFLAWDWRQSGFHEYAVLRLWPVIEQYFTVGVSLLLLVVSAVARYYRVPLGRNMRGLISGFGIYLCLYAANFAALQVVPQYHLAWQWLSTIMYSAMVTCWLWAFWNMAPARHAANASMVRPARREQWNDVWAGALGEARRRL